MSTFAEKVVDFEIAVRLSLAYALSPDLLLLTLSAHTGRERSRPRQDSFQAGLLS